MKYLLFFLFFTFNCYGQYIEALPNNSLYEEISKQDDRLIPNSKWFNAAVDGAIYLRGLGSKDFYHGGGYWTQLRSEVRLEEHFRLNTRSIFYSGSNSFGYTPENHDYHLFSFFAKLPKINSFQISARARDLETVTIGNGLILQDREMVGLQVNFLWPNHSIVLTREGTSGFNINGDLDILEYSLLDRVIGIGISHWSDDSSTNNKGQIAKNYYYIFSDLNIGKHKFSLETGTQNKSIAFLTKYIYENNYIKFKLQFRKYSNNFMNEYIGKISQLYTALDQLYMDYTNPLNILVTDNDVLVYSSNLDFRIPLSDSFEINMQNEVGKFDFVDKVDDTFYFYRLALKYSPYTPRKESLSLYVSNKILKDSYFKPPSLFSHSNSVKFVEEPFFGIDAKFRF